MDLLEATVDISVELVNFINVDLLSKGDYRVSLAIEPSEKLKSCVESVARSEYAEKPEVKDNAIGYSKSLEIEFKHSRHSLDQLFNFQVTFLVDARQPIETANNTDIKLRLTLWGVAHRNIKSSPLRVREAMMEPLSSRVLTLHIPVQEGLHWATPVLFDFCHRCAVGVVIHAQLWSLSQPKLWKLSGNGVSSSSNSSRATNIRSTAYHLGYESSPLQVTPSNSNAQLANGTHLTADVRNNTGREFRGSNSSYDVAGSNVVSSQPTETTGLLPNGFSGGLNSSTQVSPGSGGIASGDIEHVLFGRALLPTDTMNDFNVSEVMNLSKNIFYTLLVAQKSIHAAMQVHNQHFSPPLDLESRQFETPQKLRQFMNKVTQCEFPDDVVAVVGTNLASLDAENMLLWEEYMRAATIMSCELYANTEMLAPNHTLNAYLFNLHHDMMIQKYSEAFFYSYRQKALAAVFASSEVRQQVSELLRNHDYIKALPPFPIECPDSQLNALNMPIIFEEIYVENPTEYIMSVNQKETGSGMKNMYSRSISQPTSSQKGITRDTTGYNPESNEALANGRGPMYSSPVAMSQKTPELVTPKDVNLNKKYGASSSQGSLSTSIILQSTRPSISARTRHIEMCSECRNQKSLEKSLSISNINLETLSCQDRLSTRSRVFSSKMKRSVSSDAKLNEISMDLETAISGMGELLTTSNMDHVKKRHQANTNNEICRFCRISQEIDKNISLSQAKLQMSTLPSEFELVPFDNIQMANLRTVSPFQTILPGFVESETVTPFVDDVRCSRIEPMLYTPKCMKKICTMRNEAEKLLTENKIRLNWYSNLNPSKYACRQPYFLERLNEFYQDGGGTPASHLVICVHGLDGNSQDLRTLRTFVLMGMKLPLSNIKFLMSRANEDDTYEEIEALTERLVDEIDAHIGQLNVSVSRISFVGHSLGALMARAALASPKMQKYHKMLYTFLSLAGPHLGTGYQSSKLVSAGLWVFQKIKKSPAIYQLSLKDEINLEKTFIYRLSTKKGLEYFKNVLLVSSHQDKYVPPHSARIEMCERAVKDDSPFGRAYRTMVDNILSPLISNPNLKLVRYDVSFPLSPSTANNLIGRTAHIAVLDSEVWLEKFFTIVGLKYFT